MKTELQISGKAELNKQEIMQAALAYVDNSRKMNEAIDAYLRMKGVGTAVRVRYHRADGSIDQAVAEIKEVRKTGSVIVHFSDDPKEERETTSGFTRPNIGVFAYIRELIADERKAGRKAMSFEEMFKTVSFSFPRLTQKQMRVYLYDKRLLTGVRYDGKNKIVTF